jgi:hypothetical protein
VEFVLRLFRGKRGDLRITNRISTIITHPTVNSNHRDGAQTHARVRREDIIRTGIHIAQQSAAPREASI